MADAAGINKIKGKIWLSSFLTMMQYSRFPNENRCNHITVSRFWLQLWGQNAVFTMLLGKLKELICIVLDLINIFPEGF